MTNQDLTELQVEVSELEKENQELQERVKELEVNLAYMADQLKHSQNREETVESLL